MGEFASFWTPGWHFRKRHLMVVSLLVLVLVTAKARGAVSHRRIEGVFRGIASLIGTPAHADTGRDDVPALSVCADEMSPLIERKARSEVTSRRAEGLRCEPRIITVEWIPYANSLDENPAQFGGGKRIFPGARQPGLKAHEFRQVLVRVRVRPPTAGVTIFLRSFDVDDSSGLFATGRGGDNQHTLARPTDPILNIGMLEGFIPNQSVAMETDARGSVTAVFIVTMQPGDNFKVVASVDRALIQRLVVKGQEIRDSLTENVLAGARARHLEGDEAVTTELLTVWRRLHVEVDSMPGQSTMKMRRRSERLEHVDMEDAMTDGESAERSEGPSGGDRETTGDAVLPHADQRR